MEALWFWLAAVTIAVYVVADGVDFGAGMLHLRVARDDAERRAVLGAIGPYWDGNEVWLLAAGGVLFLAFPPVLAAGLSGFYLPIMMVLWTLILRGIAIEFRSHEDHVLWRAFWDGVFALASTLLPVLLGVALGNVVRGVPLDHTRYFHIPLWTDFGTAPPVGALDWYTVLVGVFSAVALAAHGAVFLAWKTSGAVRDRALRAALPLWFGVVALLPVVTWATASVNPDLFRGFAERPTAWLLAAGWVAGLIGAIGATREHRPLPAFVASSVFLGALLAATAASTFPVLLRATGGEALHLTAYNSAAGAASLRTGLWWWGLGIPLALVYVAVLLRVHQRR